MAVHLVLLAVPAVAGGFLQAFQLAFLLWPFNLALPLARDLPRACIALRGIASLYAAGLHGYVSGARLSVQLMQARTQSRSQREEQDDDPVGVALTTREDAVAHAMVAFHDIY